MNTINELFEILKKDILYKDIEFTRYQEVLTCIVLEPEQDILVTSTMVELENLCEEYGCFSFVKIEDGKLAIFVLEES